jgi:multidrug efflux pump subunit AcrB
MKWNVSAWAIRNPAPSILLFVVLCATGLHAFFGLPEMRFPNADIPKVTVTISLTGVAPAELETQVTRKVENALAAVAGVRHITSTILDGSSSSSVEFRLDVNPEQAFNDVQEAIAKIRSNLPVTIDEPSIQRDTIQDEAIRTYAISDPALTVEQLSWFIDETVLGQLQGLEGVGKVERVGGVTREIRVHLDADKLMALGATAADVNKQLLLANVDLTGGKSRLGGAEHTIRSLASASSIENLGATRIIVSGNRTARLADLGPIEDLWEEPQSFARLDGKPMVAVAVYAARGASDVSVGNAVAARVQALTKANPAINFRQIDDKTGYTAGNYQAAMHTLHEGAALSVLVVLLFLRDVRATLIAGIALPLSAIPTFWAMSMLGFSLNLVTLLGITLVTGVLVDDAIVEIENIVRHLHMGKSPYRAAMEASDEIGLTVVAISATVIFIFGPVSFMPGVAGRYFKQFGMTIACAVFFSLLVARFITPLAAAFLMRPPSAGDGSDGRPIYRGVRSELFRKLRLLVPAAMVAGLATVSLERFAAQLPPDTLLGSLARTVASVGGFTIAEGLLGCAAVIAMTLVWIGRPHPDPSASPDGRVMRLYIRLLTMTLARGMRWVTLGLGIVSFVIAIWAMRFLPSEFIPQADDGRLRASIELPPGTTLDATAAMTDRIASALKTVPEVLGVYVMGGRSSSGTNEPRRAALVLRLLPKEDRVRSQKDLQTVVSGILSTVPDIRFTFDNHSVAAVVGQDGDRVTKGAVALEAVMRKDPLFVNPTILGSYARPEIRIVPKMDQASTFGIAPSVIAETIRIATTGESPSNLAKFNVDGHQVPIRVELEQSARQNLDLLSMLQVPVQGGSVPLSAVADVSFGHGPASIERYDRARLVTIGFDPAKGHTSGEGDDRTALMAAAGLFPPGVHLAEMGDAELQVEMFSGFGMAMGFGIMLVFVVLVLLFKSPFQPLTILVSLPLSLGGVVVAMILTKSPFSLPVVIGLLMLMGIVTKNAIMLVDFSNARVRQGVDLKAAVVDAGRQRARPIIMTTLAMTAGMVPAAFSVGAGGEFRAPMAIAVMGGLLASTVLSLVLVPGVYTIMEDVSRVSGRLFRWSLQPNEPDDDTELHSRPPTPNGDDVPGSAVSAS